VQGIQTDNEILRQNQAGNSNTKEFNRLEVTLVLSGRETKEV
jgi:hypothetical protein